MTPRAGGRPEQWTTADAYDRFMGRWSTLLGRRFTEWLDQPARLDWLEVGCGTGSLTSAITELADPARVVAVDPSLAFLTAAGQRVGDTRVTFAQGSAEKLPAGIGLFDAVVSALVLNFVPEPEYALGHMAGVTRRGGTLAACVWDYAGKMEMFRYFWDAAAALFPRAQRLDEGVRFERFGADGLRALFAQSLSSVEVADLTIATHFASFDDYWLPFQGVQGPAPGFVAALDEEERTGLREALRTRLPTAADGSISLTARAWAVRGTVARPRP